MDKNHRNGYKKQGFTLVEIMIALAVTGIIMGALVVVFANQHETYIQQTDLAKAQSNSRGALFRLSRDIRMAGYTSIPYGIGQMSVDGDAYGLVTLRDGATVIPNPNRSSTLGNSLPGGGGDAIEIWGNFSRQGTMLQTTSPINIGDTNLRVNDPSIFKSQGPNTPGWIAVGDNQRNVEIHEVQNGDTNPIQLAGSATFQNAYQPSATPIYVAPVYRRIYYVDPAGATAPTGEDIPVLVMRNCTAENCTLSSNFQEITVAEGIDELELFYSVADASAGTITQNQQMVCDPCTVRSARIRIRTRSTAERDTPLLQEFATTVRVRNLGLEVTSCQIAGCGINY